LWAGLSASARYRDRFSFVLILGRNPPVPLASDAVLTPGQAAFL
jgi:hypothetical protein